MGVQQFTGVENVISRILAALQSAFTAIILGLFEALAFILFSLVPATLFAFFVTLFLYAFYSKYVEAGHS